MHIDFIGVGAIKAGTSWLYHNLWYQDDFWLPPEKELHYFNHLSNPQRILFQRKTKRFKRFFSSEVLLNNAKRNWYLNYLLIKPSNKWYVSLFPEESHLCCGEITPQYAIINQESIQAAQSINPDLKIIYCLRNPVDRALSHLKMILKTSKNPASIERILNRKTFNDHSDYVTNYKRWTSIFDPSQILVIYYDELIESPQKYLAKVVRFLRPDGETIFMDEHIESRPASFSNPIPDNTKLLLAEKYRPCIEEQHSFFNNRFTRVWLEQTDKILTER